MIEERLYQLLHKILPVVQPIQIGIEDHDSPEWHANWYIPELVATLFSERYTDELMSYFWFVPQYFSTRDNARKGILIERCKGTGFKGLDEWERNFSYPRWKQPKDNHLDTDKALLSFEYLKKTYPMVATDCDKAITLLNEVQV